MSNDATTFLQALWGTSPAESLIGLWRKRDKRSLYFDSIEAAAIAVDTDGQESDLYVYAGSARKRTPAGKRWTNETIAAIPGVWADIDVNGGPEGKSGAATNVDAALALAEELIVPTLVVNSGYGIQAWWLFHDVWAFENVAARAEAVAMSQGFQGVLKAAARRAGFSIDSTHDLARLMRAPGSLNLKDAAEAVPVALLDDGGPRYTLKEIKEIASQHVVVAREARSSSVSGVDPERVPAMKLMQLQDALEDFKKAWEHKPRRVSEKDWSMSEWDLALANGMVAAGWVDQEIADTLALHRDRYEAGGEKNRRADYFEKTIRRARNSTYAVNRHEEREEAVERLEEVARDGDAATPEQTLSFFHKVVGGPEIKEFIQYGTDAESVRYKIILDDGRDVQLGDSLAILSQSRFGANYLPVTGHVIPNMKPASWKSVVQGLMKAVTLVQSEEDTLASRAIGWVNEFTERRWSTDKDLACVSNDPFQQNDEVFISMGKLSQWLRRIRGERMADADIRQALMAAGFERVTINYTKSDGKKSTRSYYHTHKTTLEKA